MCAVPTLEEEDARRPNREHQTLTQEKTRIVNRMKGALVRLGIHNFNPKLRKAEERLEALRTPEGTPIAPNTLAELKRDMARLKLLKSQLAEIERSRKARLEAEPSGPPVLVQLLAQVKGLGLETADMLVHEVMTRRLRDRRAVARFAGGSRRREKGLAKAGSARVRRGMIQLAWRFLIHQKQSQLAQWWRKQVEGGRGKKTMIVALARKLLIALWRLATTGVVPEDWALHPQT
jgi:transposase